MINITKEEIEEAIEECIELQDKLDKIKGKQL